MWSLHTSGFPSSRRQSDPAVPNKHVNLTVERHRRSIPSVLRTPAAGYARR